MSGVAALGMAVVTGAQTAVGAAVAARLEAEGFEVMRVAADARDEAAMEAALGRVGARLVAVVNAGEGPVDTAFKATSGERFRAVWEAEVERVVLGTRAALRAFRNLGTGGAIVNLAGHGRGPAAAAAAGALDHFCRIAAVEAGGLAAPVRVTLARGGQGAAGLAALAAAAAYLAGPRGRMVTGVTVIAGEAR